jgi:hypothetical protein
VRLDVTDSQRRAPLLAWGVSDLPLGAIAGIAVNAMLETLSGLISCLVRPRDWPIFALTITCPVEQSTRMVQTLAALRSEVPGRLAWRFVEDSSRVLRSPRVTGAGPEAVFPGDPLARLFQAESRAVLSTICRVRTRWLLGPIGLWALAFCPPIKRQMQHPPNASRRIESLGPLRVDRPPRTNSKGVVAKVPPGQTFVHQPKDDYKISHVSPGL